ncbi:ArnT family glycosyltransferase [Synechococcus elongatus]|uniref:Glycosyltransferase RgtA/B/C/D-like domain-containing protein n=1 Tax=Synechococcus elongatus (strain ATCC 33912 / PCC 7942 / FACHB-805) TaxID=1140 RepID=Q31KZ3_SYNE7|nr:glycosyltransferase family 39 protein [Synechococcus elongatus]MBD2688068.1 glycosyltransferase family 39 protein [Synechococcus elongatus FACHB-1061]ABB58276.1 conserved hypothetical protein [Synechococcus elongatus PCC 7942 = FACHB-805]AJD57254.1 hypothetical protein M744_05105 [Synechococcus elongatus UTEX 2973]MBD2586997.1 glycosyltransferase family 39 protein [Synechococcus elongatus FACHB-242]MBD2706221.1 glycosyltransferase family 39 protein [Synechococcus elongatus PCC 7942 = FACHB-
MRASDRWAAVIVGLSLLFRTGVAWVLPSGYDEVYYHLYTQHPALSYFDHPAAVGISAAIGTALLGSASALSLRLATLGIFSLALVGVYRIGCRLFSERVGLVAMAIAAIAPIMQVGAGILVLPDGPLILFATVAAWLGAIEFFPKSPYQPSPRLIGICVALGLACLSKYHAFVLGAGLVGFCLTSARHRVVFRSRWFWLGAIAFAVCLLPLLIWNGQQDWISLRFQSGRVESDRFYSIGDALLALLVNFGYLFPTLGIPLFASIGITLYQLWRQPIELERNERYAFLLWLSAPIVLLFTVLGGRIQILPTWTMPGYWFATLLLAAQVVNWWQAHPKSRRVQRWLVGSAIAVVLLSSLAVGQVRWGWLQSPGSPLGLPLIPAYDDGSTELLQPEQIRAAIAERPDLLARLKAADFYASNQFFLPGYFALAIDPLVPKPFTLFGTDPRGFAFWSNPEDWLGKNAVLWTTERFQEEWPQSIERYFEKIEWLADVPISRAGVPVQTIRLYWGERMQVPYDGWPY